MTVTKSKNKERLLSRVDNNKGIFYHYVLLLLLNDETSYDYKTPLTKTTLQ